MRAGAQGPGRSPQEGLQEVAAGRYGSSEQMCMRLFKGDLHLALTMPLHPLCALCKVKDREKPQSSNRSIQQELIWKLLQGRP